MSVNLRLPSASFVLLVVLSACWHVAAPPERLQTKSPADPTSSTAIAAFPNTSKGSQASAQHPDCERPLPILLPPNPGHSMASTAPACTGTSAPVPCDEHTPCPADQRCLTPEFGQPGVCALTVDGWHGGVPVSYRDGECVGLTSEADRSAIWCAGSGGFDGSEYDAQQAGQKLRGQVCREHSECQLGLVCNAIGQTWGEGYGRCLCPEADLTVIEDPPSCWFDHPAIPWGTRAAVDGSCIAAASPGWSIEVVTEHSDYGFDAAVDAQGKLHAALFSYVDGQGMSQQYAVFAHALRGAAGWQFEFAPELWNDSPPSLAVDGSGALHIAIGSQGLQPKYATNRSGSWVVQSVGTTYFDVPRVELALDAHDTPFLSYATGTAFPNVTDTAGLHYVTPVAGELVDQLVVGQAVSSFAFVDVAGTPTWFYETGTVDPQLMIATQQAGKFWTTTIANGSNVVAAVTRAGEAVLAYDVHATDAEHNRRAQVRLVRGDKDVAVWQLSDGHFLNLAATPSLALDSADRAWLVHGAPQGWVLEQPVGAAWQLVPLFREIDSLQPPVLLLDANDEAHVFFQRWLHDSVFQLLHVFHGSCPPG